MHYVRAYTTPLILSSSRDPSRMRLYEDLQIGYIILSGGCDLYRFE